MGGVVHTDGATPARLPVRVAPVNPYVRIVAGLSGLLARLPGTAVEAAPPLSLDESTRSEPVDVALYDTYGALDLEGDVDSLCARRDVAQVVVLSAEVEPEMVTDLMRRGVAAVVSKLEPTVEVVRSILIAAGQEVDGAGDTTARDLSS